MPREGMKVFVLADCVNREMIGNALKVFPTICTGFPTASLHIFGNGLDSESAARVGAEAERVGASYTAQEGISHGQWIESLIEEENEPFWICNSDTIFHAPVEHWFATSTKLFAGKYEPDRVEPSTQTKHVARLNPALMWISSALRAQIRAWPGTPTFSAEKIMIREAYVPEAGGVLFFGATAGLYQSLAGDGEAFTPEQNKSFTLACLPPASTDPLKMNWPVCNRLGPAG